MTTLVAEVETIASITIAFSTCGEGIKGLIAEMEAIQRQLVQSEIEIVQSVVFVARTPRGRMLLVLDKRRDPLATRVAHEWFRLLRKGKRTWTYDRS